jgi:hypothetical protein
MTRDGQGIGPEETPPPTSTRWSQPEPGEDDALLPPFVPGRRDEADGAASEAGEATEPAATADAVVDTPNLAVDTTEAVSGTEELGVDAVDPAPVDTPEPDDGWFPFDEPVDGEPFPWADPPEVESEAPVEGDQPKEPVAESVGERMGETIEEPWSTDDEPWSTEADEQFAEVEAAAAQMHAEAGADPMGEVADRLEALAARLRDQGARGVEEGMASSDRMTALLAGLIAGYLAGLAD